MHRNVETTTRAGSYVSDIIKSDSFADDSFAPVARDLTLNSMVCVPTETPSETSVPVLAAFSSHLNGNNSSSPEEIDHDFSFKDARVELYRKRDQLALAEAQVASLRHRIQVLEAYTSPHKGHAQDESRTTKHMYDDDNNTRKRKRARESGTPPDFGSFLSKELMVNNEAVFLPTNRYGPATSDSLPQNDSSDNRNPGIIIDSYARSIQGEAGTRQLPYQGLDYAVLVNNNQGRASTATRSITGQELLLIDDTQHSSFDFGYASFRPKPFNCGSTAIVHSPEQSIMVS